MQDLLLKDLTADTAARKDAVPELFLNISLKRFYAVMFKGCLMASRGRNPERAARYKKIYSMITLSVPGAERMTIGQFLCYIDVNCMKFKKPDGIDKKQHIQDINKGKYLAKLFFIDTFEPMLKSYGLDSETVISKLCS